jgi:two-component system invasion response regulator UvrY
MIKVALVDDHKLLRTGLSNYIKSNPLFTVVFEADNGEDLKNTINTQNMPDVVLMDINMPLMDGYAATKWLKEHCPKVRVLALSMYDGEECIIRMLRCGARGYILKDSEPSLLVRAIDEVHRHGFFYSEMIAGHMMHLINATDAESSKKKKNNDKVLSERETELLQYMASELTYKEIAAKMFLSPKTVEGHREALCEKLDIKTRVGLVLYGVRNGIIKV